MQFNGNRRSVSSVSEINAGKVIFFQGPVAYFGDSYIHDRKAHDTTMPIEGRKMKGNDDMHKKKVFKNRRKTFLLDYKWHSVFFNHLS